MDEGILYGVAGIDVVVNSDALTDAITRRIVNANVASVPLPCQLNQVEYHTLSSLCNWMEPSLFFVTGWNA